MRDLDPSAVPDPRLADPAAAGSDPPVLEVSQALAGFHDAVRERFVAATDTPGGSYDPRSSAPQYDVLVSALSEHVAVMERVVHPLLRRRAGDDPRVAQLAPLAADLVATMHGIEQHLYGDGRAPSRSVPELRDRLVELIDEHAHVEEGLLRDVEAGLSVDERRDLAERLEAASRHAPTRPHPHAPHHPALVPMAFRVNALWDDLLDAMDVRQVSGRTPRAPKPVGMWGSYLLGTGMAPAPAPAPDDDGTTVDDQAPDEGRGRSRAG